MSDYPYGQFNEIYASHTPTPPQQQQQHAPAHPQWETLDPMDAALQQQHHDLEMQMQSPLDHASDMTPTPTSTSFHTRQLEIDLEEPQFLVPSQGQSPVNDAPILLHPPHEVPQHYAPQPHQMTQYPHHQMSMSRPGSSLGQPSMLLRSNSAQPPTPGPSSTGANPVSRSAGGVVRSVPTRGGRAALANPYYRQPPVLTSNFLVGSSSSSMAAPGGSPSPTGGSAASPTATGSGRSKKSNVRWSDAATTAPSRGMSAPTSTTRARVASSSKEPVPLFGVSPPATNSPQVPSRPSFGGQNTSHSPQTQSPLSRLPPLSRIPAQRSPKPTASANPITSSFREIQKPIRSLLGLRHIPADMQYSYPERTLTASLEVPGVRREKVQVTMGTCYFNWIKYVCVQAESDPVFEPSQPYSVSGSTPATLQEVSEPEKQKGRDEDRENQPISEEGTVPQDQPLKEQPSRSAALDTTSFGIPKMPARAKGGAISRIVNPNLRERKFGIARRVIQVPSRTTLEDVDAKLEDGVLTLKIYCGEPFEGNDEQFVPVR